MNTVESFFYISIGGIIGGIVTILLKYAYKSKCNTVNLCCGLIQYNRNVQEEVKEDINHPQEI
jgi:hypothetical protein